MPAPRSLSVLAVHRPRTAILVPACVVALLAGSARAGVLSYAFSTYLGGSLGESVGGDGTGVAVAANGDVIVSGDTDSTDFPTKDALQGIPPGRLSAFLSRLRPDGTLVFSTYLG